MKPPRTLWGWKVDPFTVAQLVTQCQRVGGDLRIWGISLFGIAFGMVVNTKREAA